MNWYAGPTLLGYLEQADVAPVHDVEQPFRMAVQWVNRPDADFRGYCGLIAAGEVYAGMPVQIWPSGRMAHVDRILTAGSEADVALAGESVALTFAEEIDVSRGDVIAEAAVPPLVADRLAARVVWMSEEPLTPGRAYLVKIGTCAAKATVEPGLQVIDLDSREANASDTLAHNGIGTCILQLDRPVAVDRYQDNRATGGFILIDPESHDTIGMGIVEAAHRSVTARQDADAVARHRVVKRLLAQANESRLRSAAKALTWRVIASLAAFLVALAVTGSVGIAGTVALVDIASRTILYYLHERMWSKVAWGMRAALAGGATMTAGLAPGAETLPAYQDASAPHAGERNGAAP